MAAVLRYTSETLEYLKKIGAGVNEIREIQTIILDFTAKAIYGLAEEGKQREYKEAQEQAAYNRRAEARARKRNNSAEKEQQRK